MTCVNYLCRVRDASHPAAFVFEDTQGRLRQASSSLSSGGIHQVLPWSAEW